MRATVVVALCCAALAAAGVAAAVAVADDPVEPPTTTTDTTTPPTDTTPAPTDTTTAPTDTSTAPTDTSTAPTDTSTAPTDTTPGTTSPPPAPGPPPISWGVADDASKYADDGGAWFYGMLAGANLAQNRWTVAWDPSNPTAIEDLPFLERAAPVAQAAGIHIVLVLDSQRASQHDPWQFCTWAQQVASTVKDWGIHDYVLWNEPNTRLYWSPQKSRAGRDIAAPVYEVLLAVCYDAIHAADPDAKVIGMGLSPRASTSDSNNPLAFLRDVGASYRASGRTLPIMDQLSVHPYPNPSNPTDGPDVGYASPDRFGIPNLDRVKQAVYDAFNGTAQPTTLNGLTLRIDEVGWQTNTAGLSQYVNDENVSVVDQATQLRYLRTTTERYFACDPTVTDVDLFLLVDEKYRNGRDENGKYLGGGWQSGLLTAGGEGVSQPKLAYTALAADWGAGRSACTGPPVSWSPGRSGVQAKPPTRAKRQKKRR